MRPTIVVLLALGLPPAYTAPAPRLPAASPAVSPGLGLPVSAPVVRVGLDGDGTEVRVGADGPFRILDPATGTEIWPERAPGEVLVVREGGRAGVAERVHRVQVGAFRTEAQATELAERLERELREPADATWEAARGVFRVRVGRGADAGQLAALLAAVRGSGYPDAWIVTERVQRLEGGALRLLDARWDVRPSGAARLVVAPAGAARVTVGGKPYRGVVEVRLTPYGEVVAINELNLEDYLRGVVPDELGPAVFPELEALKAQAVAARTYAVANLGQFAELGYDICDTPRCQVYGGARSEHPLSNRAVEETRGEVLVHAGAPIQALFTSTCGGRTEDVAAVFPELDAPYLKSVPCGPDAEAAGPALLRGRPVEDVEAGLAVAGDPETLALAALVAHGVVPRAAFDPAWRAQAVRADEATAWFAALSRAAGKPGLAAIEGLPARLALWRAAAETLGPAADERAAAGDLDVAVPAEDLDGLAAADRALVVSLATRGVVVPRGGRVGPGEIPPRGEVLGWIAHAAALYDAAPLDDARVTRVGGRPALRAGKATLEFDAGEVDFLAENGGLWHRAASLVLAPGDRVLVAAPRGTVRLVAAREVAGRSDDRGSERYRWTVTKERAELEKSLAAVAPVGTLRDLRVLARGVSGRVARIEVAGSAGSAVVEGFRIRRALDLPETRFGVDLQRAEDGSVRRVTFRGRGWGHGVGLCQYGAVGRARRGADYREILLHYYSGAEFARIDGPPA
ncbi:MAG: SpoIID/LytB domain-containing protein [Acidobacteria bacterium]|nr:SpoIID/LytB domain-containing protein [Acidobacteriota bacterium]